MKAILLSVFMLLAWAGFHWMKQVDAFIAHHVKGPEEAPGRMRNNGK